MSGGSLKDGDALELASAAFFQMHGYFVRRGVKLSAAAGEKDVTDADLIAIRFHVPVREERLVVDCKDRKASRPFERILWTLGLASFVKAQQPVVVTPKPIPPVREFAARGGVEVISAEQVTSYVSSQPSVTLYGDADVGRAMRLARVASVKSAETKDLMHELARVRQMLVIGSSTTNFNRLILTVRRLRALRTGADSDLTWLRDFVCSDAVVTSLLMLLRFAEESKWTPEKDWRVNLGRRLTYGDVQPAKALQLAKIALEQPFHDGLPPPEYAEEVSSLVAHLIAHSMVSVWTPLAADYLLTSGTARHGTISEIPGIPAAILASVVSLVRRAISTIDYAAGSPSSSRGKTGAPSPTVEEAMPSDKLERTTSQLSLSMEERQELENDDRSSVTDDS